MKQAVMDVLGRVHMCEFYVDSVTKEIEITPPDGYMIVKHIGSPPTLVQTKESMREFNPRCCQPEYCKKNAPEDYYGAFCRSCED